MNTEELKIIMDALVSLGEAGKSGFIWWLVLKYGMHYLAVILFLLLSALCIRLAIVRLTNLTDGNKLGGELCHMLNIQTHGGYSWENEYFRTQLRAAIISKVRDLQAASSK